MLSSNTKSSIQKRRSQHSRQNSTPAAFDAHKVRPLPANIRQTRQRTGISHDLRGLDLEVIHIPEQDQFPDVPLKIESFQQEDSTVSITNLGQTPQHDLQVAQPHSQHQPGPQDTFMNSPVQQSLPSPRTPHRTIMPTSPTRRSSSPSKPPTEQQLKELHEHIQSVYGSCGQVFINILPTPTPTPQKPMQQMQGHELLDTAPMPSDFSDMADISLDTPANFDFSFEHPDGDMGYESSSYCTSDAVSLSPMSSPQQKSIRPFLEGIQEYPVEEMAFSHAPSFPPPTNMVDNFNQSPAPYPESLRGPSAYPELEADATIEYTGITSEEVQRFISEQDPVTSKWTCLYPGCDKTFGRRENIRSHVQTHLGDRQYRCNGCGKCFVRQHDLKRHAKIHTGNKPYKCPCGAGFARQDALTRHRQRGMCVGGFPDAVRRQAKRGRPKKNRPDMEERVKKATRTRRALASAASSVSAGSPPSDTQSMGYSPTPLESFESMDTSDISKLLPPMGNFGDMVSTTDPFSFDTASSPFSGGAHVTDESFASSASFIADDSMNLLQQLSNTNHTPPMSPVDSRPASSDDAKATGYSTAPKAASTPSRSSLHSNPFSTPPTSPVEPPRDELDELFNSLPDPNSYSHFDMEMKALGDFTSFETTQCEPLDFSM